MKFWQPDFDRTVHRLSAPHPVFVSAILTKAYIVYEGVLGITLANRYFAYVRPYISYDGPYIVYDTPYFDYRRPYFAYGKGGNSLDDRINFWQVFSVAL